MKQLKITVNGKTYDVQVEEMGTDTVATPQPQPKPSTPVEAEQKQAVAQEQAVTSAPITPALGKGDPVNSPMPGNIVKISVTAGQSVKKGDVLLVLEAMKMENEICAPRDAVVGNICVIVGETVDSGKTLLNLI